MRINPWIFIALLIAAFLIGRSYGDHRTAAEYRQKIDSAKTGTRIVTEKVTTKQIKADMTINWTEVHKAVTLFNWATDNAHEWRNIGEHPSKAEIRQAEIRMLERYCLFKQFEYRFWPLNEGSQAAILHSVKLPAEYKETSGNLEKFREWVGYEYTEVDGMSAWTICDDGTDWRTAKKLQEKLQKKGLLKRNVDWSTGPNPFLGQKE